jgi:hypothetical protein
MKNGLKDTLILAARPLAASYSEQTADVVLPVGEWRFRFEAMTAVRRERIRANFVGDSPVARFISGTKYRKSRWGQFTN